jgi:2-hydroxy-6-oxo-octa-2,4-dienoate hydrolase
MLRMFPHDQSLVTQEMVDARYEASLRMGTEAFKALVPLDAVNQPDFEVGGVPEKVAARLQKPTLVRHGRDDRVVPLELGIRLNRAIPNSELHVFGNCGHWVQIERHARFVRMVREFLQS